MKSIAVLAVAVLAIMGHPAIAQDVPSSARTIVVSGVGRAEAAPDTFRVEAGLLGRGASQDEAIGELVRLQARVTEALTGLSGLTASDLTTGLPDVRAVYAPDCQSARYNQASPDCAVVGYAATSSLTLIAQPATRGGDAVSIAAQNGAPNARLVSVYLADDQDLRERSARAAFEDARRQAQAIASASGQTLGAPLRITDPQAAPGESTVVDYLATMPALSNARVANTPIVIVPGPSRVERRLTVVFGVQ